MYEQRRESSPPRPLAKFYILGKQVKQIVKGGRYPQEDASPAPAFSEAAGKGARHSVWVSSPIRQRSQGALRAAPPSSTSSSPDQRSPGSRGAPAFRSHRTFLSRAGRPQEPMRGTGWGAKGGDGDGLPLTPAAPGPRRHPAPPPPAARLPGCAPRSRRLPVAASAAPAARRALRPAPPTTPKLGPQRPAAAGGARWATVGGGAPRPLGCPWSAARSPLKRLPLLPWLKRPPSQSGRKGDCGGVRFSG